MLLIYMSYAVGRAPSGWSPRLRLQSPPTRADSGHGGGLRASSLPIYGPGGSDRI